MERAQLRGRTNFDAYKKSSNYSPICLCIHSCVQKHILEHLPRVRLCVIDPVEQLLSQTGYDLTVEADYDARSYSNAQWSRDPSLS